MKGAVWAIVKKDIRQIFSSRQTMLPMIIVPLVFSVFMPLSIVSSMTGGNYSDKHDIATYLGQIVSNQDIMSQISKLATPDQQMIYLTVNYLFMPLFIIIPTMVSSIIAASCIVGEKEKKTMETLLYSPVPMGRMFWAKVLASFLPAIVLTFIAVAIYGCIVDIGTYKLFGENIFPTANWLIYLFLLTPAFSLLATVLMVFVSAKAKTFQAAQQWSVLIILPVIILLFAQTSGAFLISQEISILFGVALLALDVLLVFKGLGRFTREKLIG